MGGAGSGTWYRWDKRTTLEEVKRLDVRRLQRQGYLRPWASGLLTWRRGNQEAGSVSVAMRDGRLVVEYRYRRRGAEDWHDVRQVITLDWTPCHYGGTRPWFLWPGCSRRVVVLCGYARLFLCRHCSRLPYSSQSETVQDRRYRKAWKIRDRLGASHNLTEYIRPWQKPKGMHRRTWERLCAEEAAVHTAIDDVMYEALERLLRHG